jgi:hypothetical protein
MWLVGTAIIGTDALSKLPSGEQPVGFNHRTFAMHPFGFNGIEPRALLGQQERQNPNPFAHLFHVLIVLPDPQANLFADVPGRMIPNQQPGGFSHHCQTVGAPVEKLRGDPTDGTARPKTEPHLLAFGMNWGGLLPENAITGQCFGIRIALLPGLFDQMNRMIGILPSVHMRQSKPAPPHLVEKPNCPGRLLAGPGD